MRVIKQFDKLMMVALPAALTGCMVGPDFHQPAAPLVGHYTQSSLPKKTVSTKGAGQAGKAQRFITAQDLPAEWWTLFHSAPLNNLINRGLAHSPTLEAAQATLRQSQEVLNAQIGNSMFPAVSATLSGQRQRITGASLGNDIQTTLFNVFMASVNVSYTPDVFGGARREIESLQAQVDYQQFQLIASYLTITTNIVTTAVSVASFSAQIEATKQLIHEQSEQLNILQKQFHLGGVSSTDVLSQQTLVDQTRATLPPLEKSLSQAKHALAVLVGDYPSEIMPSFSLNHLSLPAHLPVSLPSKLVRQRPDVRASEALFHSASAQIGVATANLFPQFPLTAAYGWSTSVPSRLFSSAVKAWSYGGQMTAPIFQGGALLAQRRAAIAAFDVAGAQYRQTVLQAFQNVADSLRAIETDARSFRLLKQAESTALKTLIITKQQYRLGGVSYINLLTAQQQYQQTRINRIRAQGLRFADTAALFQALGGGWWNRPVAKCHDPINPTHASLVCPA
jgi:NodT family efflux transporter outer membrane factor (OMF) lipoprotein